MSEKVDASTKMESSGEKSSCGCINSLISSTPDSTSTTVAVETAKSKSFTEEDEHAYAHTPFVHVPAWKSFLSFIGPGFLVSLAYLDPGNLETDLQAGANHKYELLWVILIGLVFALIIQSLAANLGVSTGRHLAELCKAEYPIFIKYCLWLLAELAVIAADVPEVIGTAFALNILLKIPVWGGVLLTGFSTLLLLGLQRYGARKLELLIAILVFVMAGCFFAEMARVKPNAKEVVEGMFIPKLSGHSATGDAIALLGALIMPHNLFLHSALMLSRKVPKSVHGINDAVNSSYMRADLLCWWHSSSMWLWSQSPEQFVQLAISQRRMLKDVEISISTPHPSSYRTCWGVRLVQYFMPWHF
ncbi:hypothetical protein Droror1_Dr00005114 [Drosera rotundifolia]